MSLDLLHAKRNEWLANPVGFVRDVFDETPEDWQAEALMALANGKPTARVGMCACKGPGKSFCLAVGTWWHLATHHCSQIICTSTTSDNLKDNLWKEMGTWYSKAPMLQHFFEFGGERIVNRERPIDWWVSARSWKKGANLTDQANALAGFHGPNVMYVGDEIGDYPAGVLPAAEACLANAMPGNGKTAKLFVAGNPVDPNGPLYRITTTERHLWKVIHITGDPDDPKRSKRVSREWALEQIEKYGKESPWVLVNVFGKFPPTGFRNLLGPDEVRDAAARNYLPMQYQGAQKRLGVDVARFGDDKTVIYCRHGLRATGFVVMRDADTQAVADRVAMAYKKSGAEVVFVDETGVGGGVVDALRRHRIRAIPVNGSDAATDKHTYFNKRAEMQIRLSNWIKEGGQIPHEDTDLARDLTAPSYEFRKGLFLIEPKEEIKKRTGVSPDHSDALALTFAWEEMPARDELAIIAGRINQSGRKGGDFDPHDSLNAESVSRADFDPHRSLGGM